jgi:rhomboid protease GluP
MAEDWNDLLDGIERQPSAPDADSTETPMISPSEPPPRFKPPPMTAEMLVEPTPVDPREDFESRMSAGPPLCLALIAINTVVFIGMVLAGALESGEAIVGAGALHRDRVLAGDVWRLLSAAFLHGSWGHLFGNAIMFYIVGMACEHAYGSRRMSGIYLVSALCGSLLSIAMQPGPSVGASGAIFGVTGAVIVFFFRQQKHFYLRDKRIGIVLLIWGMWQIAGGFFNPVIDNFCHIGGFLGGAAAGWFIPPALVTRRLRDTP